MRFISCFIADSDKGTNNKRSYRWGVYSPPTTHQVSICVGTPSRCYKYVIWSIVIAKYMRLLTACWELMVLHYTPHIHTTRCTPILEITVPGPWEPQFWLCAFWMVREKRGVRGRVPSRPCRRAAHPFVFLFSFVGWVVGVHTRGPESVGKFVLKSARVLLLPCG